jgi:hypothetical protein
MPKRTAMLMERTGLVAAVTVGPPTNITPPSIPASPVAQVNQQLTASPGSWTNNPTSFTFQWNHLGSAVVLSAAQSYTPAQTDVGFQLTVTVVATNGVGSSIQVTSSPTAAVIPAGATASRVFDMLKILGVSGHAADYAGLNGATTANIVADAQYLGISIWRDGISPTSNYPIYSALFTAGIKMIGLPFPSGGDVPIADWISFARQQQTAVGVGSFFALEGPNEPANFGFTYNGVPGGGGNSWASVAAWTHDWYTAVKADSLIGTSGSNVFVLSPSLIGGEVGNYGMQYCTVVPPGPPSGVLSAAGTQFADGYNMHLYPMFQGHAQTIDPAGDAINGQLSGDLVSTFANHFPGLSLPAAQALTRGSTEFGYQVGTPSPSGTIVDIVTAGKCILNALLNLWSEGMISCVIYTFYEDAPDGGAGFGLLNGPGNPKTSGVYLHNLTTILNDSGATKATFTPTAANFTLSGMPATAQSQLFEKSNGAFEIVIWNKVSSWNFTAGAPITVAPTTVTVNFSVSQSVVNTYDPTVQATPIATANNVGSVNVALRDYPMIVELPGAGQAPVNTVIPVLSTSSPSQGTALSMTNGTWTGTSITFTYAWMRAFPTPDVLAFTAASGSTVSVGTVPNFATENSNKTWSITNPDNLTLVFQVDPGDVFPPDTGLNTFGQPGSACRSDITGIASPFTPGTEIEVSYNFTMTSLTARTEGGAINIGQFHNDDVALGGLTFPPFQFDLQPFDFMEVRIGNLAASPAPTGAVGAPFNMVTNGVSQNYYLMYADPNPIVRGHTYAIRIQVKFGPSGFLNVFRDGVQIVSSTGQFGFGFNNYWMCGIWGNVTAANQVAKYANLLVTPGPLVLGTAASYTPGAADVGAALIGTVTATNNFGAASASTLISGPVTNPVVGTPVNTAIPTVVGATIKGATLASSQGSWSNNPNCWTYQWNRAGVAIPGATGSTYNPVTADVGTQLSVAVIASNNVGPSASAANSLNTGVITAT